MIALLVCAAVLVADQPALPAANGTVIIEAQEWPAKPGPRTIQTYIYYPDKQLSSVNESTGLMLCLHNWGGTGAIGAPDPIAVADRYNVIAICVDYLQSGKWDPAAGLPYDFGYLQALDALRALHHVFDALDASKIPFARGRIYACGGSGGGNVSLMANKLAPRTFACIVDISGMAKLTDDIAYGLPGGSELNAGYKKKEVSHQSTNGNPRALTAGAQELRYVGNPTHLKTMTESGSRATVVVIHGADDTVCSVEDVREMVGNMKQAGIDVMPHFITKQDIDGKRIKDTGHSIGDRTGLLFHYADDFLQPGSAKLRVREGKIDFELRDEVVRYETTDGAYVISYLDGAPVGRFESR